MYKLAILYSIIWLSIGRSFGQLNESDTSKFQLRINFTGNFQKGNVEVIAIRSKIEMSWTPIQNMVFKSQNSSLYQAFYSKEADNDIFSRNFLYYKPENKIYPFGIQYISRNYRRKIELRYFVGTGLTIQLINKPLHVSKLSASVVHEQTNFIENKYNFISYNGTSKINLWRTTTYVGGWDYLLHKNLRFYYDAYLQAALNNKNNYRTQIDIGIDFPFWKGLSFNIIYNWTHENVVIYKINQEDKILTFGFAYNLKLKH